MQQCHVCFGTAFSHEEGLIVCLTCGTQGEAFVEEAADFDAALAEGARARVRIRGPAAAALRAAASQQQQQQQGATTTAAPAALHPPPLSLSGEHAVAASLLALQRSLAGILDVLIEKHRLDPSAKLEAKRLWALAVAAARVFGSSDDGDDDENDDSKPVAVVAEERAEGWQDAPATETRTAGQTTTATTVGKSSPAAVASLAVAVGRELLRRGLGPRCLLSLALLASWRAPNPSSPASPVTPLDIVRGAARGEIPFLDLTPFAAAAAAAASAAAAAAAADGDDATSSSPKPISLPPRIAQLPLVSARLLRPHSLPSPDRVAARAARLGRALLPLLRRSSSTATAANDEAAPPPLLPPLPNPAALAARWASDIGAPLQLAVVAAELHALLSPSALASVSAASAKKRTPTTRKRKKKQRRKERGRKEDESESSEGEGDGSSSDESESGSEEEGNDQRRRRPRPPPLRSTSFPTLTDDSRLDPVRSLAASLLLATKLCYGLGGPVDDVDFAKFGMGLPGLPPCPSRSDGSDDEEGEDKGDNASSSSSSSSSASAAAAFRGWRRWASTVLASSGVTLVPSLPLPRLGKDSDDYIRGVSRGVFCVTGGSLLGGGGELEAALSTRAAAASAAAERRRRRQQHQQRERSLPPAPPTSSTPSSSSRRKQKGSNSNNNARPKRNGKTWTPGNLWLVARWQPASAVQKAAARAAKASEGRGEETLDDDDVDKTARPSDFALPPSYASVLAAVSAHCGFTPRALHETAVALEEELSKAAQ